jgi:hypothetical protein
MAGLVHEKAGALRSGLIGVVAKTTQKQVGTALAKVEKNTTRALCHTRWLRFFAAE